MGREIWNYTISAPGFDGLLNDDREFTFELPNFAELVSIQFIEDERAIVMFFKCDPDEILETREFMFIDAMSTFNWDIRDRDYLGTVQVGHHIWHIFEDNE